MTDTIASRLRYAREKRGLKRTVLSELAGLGRNAVAEYETGQRLPGAETVVKLAKVLGVSCDYLLGVQENF